MRFWWLCFVLVCSGCKVKYSFTGTSIPPEVKTVAISYFPNYAPLAQPILSQTFTESLKDIFLNQTRLSLTDDFGDLQFSGEIVKYDIQAAAITGNETSAQNRLTIGVRVKFENAQNPEKNFERQFEKYQDFDSRQNLADIEAELNADIVQQLVQEIFNNSVSDW